MPSISVVIPVYNRTWELRRTLQSLADQSFRDFEVIVCDDGSSVDVRSVVDSFAGSLHLQFRRIDNSGGPARPRNVATRMANGEWISFLDSDDWWDSDRMSVVAAALGHDVDLLYHPLRVVTSRDVALRRNHPKSVGRAIRGEPLRDMALFGNPIPNSAAVVRRKLLNSVGGMCEDRRLVAFEDFDTWLQLVEGGARVRFLDRTLGSYWIGDDAISAMSERQVHRQAALFERHVARFPADLRTAAQACQHYSISSMWRRIGGRPDLEFDHLRRAKGLPTLGLRLKRQLKLVALALGGAGQSTKS
jgi:glycosyltransferase involved in cell wall biosynthesis